MLKAQDAVDLIKSKVEIFEADQILDFGDVFTLSNCISGSMGTLGDYLIDKATGKVTELGLFDFIKDIDERYGEDFKPKKLQIKDGVVVE